MMESPSAITKLSFRWSSWNREFSALSPHIWSELTSCRGHPSPRVVHTLANLPPRHILHNSGLLFQIFIPFFHKSTNKSKDKTRFKKKKSGKLYIIKKLVLQHPIPHRKNQKKKKSWYELNIPFIFFRLKHGKYCSASSILLFLELAKDFNMVAS